MDTVRALASDGPRVGRPAAVGAAIGFTLIAVVATVAGSIGGLGLGPSVGLGIFIGMWGGVGSGFMIGAIIPFARYFDAVHAEGAYRASNREAPARGHTHCVEEP